METIDIKSKIISGSEFYKIIHDRKGNLKPEFKEKEEGGLFHFHPYWSGNMHAKDFCVSLVSNKKMILGFAILFVKKKHAYRRDGIYFDVISVREDMKGRGYSKPILKEIVDFAKKEKLPILVTDATTQGEERARPFFRKYAKEQGVVVEKQ
jgi:GNAT superfamily N-acetyltransferase